MFKDVPTGSHRVIFYCKAPAIDTPDPLYDLLTTGITQQPIMAFFVKDLYFSVDRREGLYWTEAWLRAFIVTRIGMITSVRVYLYLSSVYSILFIVYCVFVSKRSMIHSFYCCDNWLTTTSAPVTGITWSQGHLSCVHIWSSHVLIEEKIQ